MAPIQARAEVTRQSIVTAGVELFGTVGYGDTDMIDVINRAETSKGTCYYHFPTMKSLAQAIIEQSNDRIAAAVGGLWETDGSMLDNMIAATFAFVAVTEHDPVARVGYQLHQAQRQVSRSAEHGFGDTEVIFTNVLRQAVAAGRVRPDIDVEETAYTLFAAVVGCRVLADIYDENPFDRLEEVWRTLLPRFATEVALPDLHAVVRTASSQYRIGV